MGNREKWRKLVAKSSVVPQRPSWLRDWWWWWVSQLVFGAESTTKGYIMAKNNVQSVSHLLCTQVIKPQIIHKPQNQAWHKFYIKQNIHKRRTQNFRRIRPFGITPVEKAHKARTRWYRGPFRRFIDTRFKKSIKKGMDRSYKKKNYKILYINA